jgi:3-oxoadipate enol-lactonase
MPHITARDGARIFYTLDGEDGRPVVLLSNSLGTTQAMWELQLAALAGRYRLLCYDSRGHGRSDAPRGPYNIELLGQDALALLDALGIARAAFAGVSKGGMVGMWLGVHAQGRLTALALCNTSAHVGAAEVWNQRIETVRAQGMVAIVPGVIDRWFTKPFQAAQPQTVERIASMLRATPPEGYIACCAAVRDMDQREAIRAIRAPTLVIAGKQDLATPPDHAHLIAERVPGAKLVELDAAHLSNIEQAEPFTRHLLDFLAGTEAIGRQL